MASWSGPGKIPVRFVSGKSVELSVRPLLRPSRQRCRSSVEQGTHLVKFVASATHVKTLFIVALVSPRPSEPSAQLASTVLSVL